jgi:hypothetical protein
LFTVERETWFVEEKSDTNKHPNMVFSRKENNPGNRKRAECTAKKQYQKFDTNILRKELRGLSPNFHIHVSVSDLYILTIGLPILLQENMWIDPGKI